MEEYRQRVTSEILINLSTIGLSGDDLAKLKEVLVQHKGDCAVRLKLTIPTKAESVIALSDEFKVGSSDEMVNDVERIFGSGTVTFV